MVSGICKRVIHSDGSNRLYLREVDNPHLDKYASALSFIYESTLLLESAFAHLLKPVPCLKLDYPCRAIGLEATAAAQ